MIADFLERLTKRKTEVARATASEWQTLVINIADGKEADADATLTTLDWLKKTPDDLKTAVELLQSRRTWSALVEAGVKAEAEHPRVVRAIEKEVATFAKIEEAHEAKLRPMHGTERAAIFQMTEAARARSELVRTASDPIRLAAVVEADERLTDLRRERREHDHRLADKSDALRQYTTRGQSSDHEQIARLEIEVANLQSESKAFDERAEKLNGESEAARRRLEVAEAI